MFLTLWKLVLNIKRLNFHYTIMNGSLLHTIHLVQLNKYSVLSLAVLIPY